MKMALVPFFSMGFFFHQVVVHAGIYEDYSRLLSDNESLNGTMPDGTGEKKCSDDNPICCSLSQGLDVCPSLAQFWKVAESFVHNPLYAEMFGSHEEEEGTDPCQECAISACSEQCATEFEKDMNPKEGSECMVCLQSDCSEPCAEAMEYLKDPTRGGEAPCEMCRTSEECMDACRKDMEEEKEPEKDSECYQSLAGFPGCKDEMDEEQMMPDGARRMTTMFGRVAKQSEQKQKATYHPIFAKRSRRTHLDADANVGRRMKAALEKGAAAWQSFKKRSHGFYHPTAAAAKLPWKPAARLQKLSWKKSLRRLQDDHEGHDHGDDDEYHDDEDHDDEYHDDEYHDDEEPNPCMVCATTEGMAKAACEENVQESKDPVPGGGCFTRIEEVCPEECAELLPHWKLCAENPEDEECKEDEEEEMDCEDECMACAMCGDSPTCMSVCSGDEPDDQKTQEGHPCHSCLHQNCYQPCLPVVDPDKAMVGYAKSMMDSDKDFQDAVKVWWMMMWPEQCSIELDASMDILGSMKTCDEAMVQMMKMFAAMSPDEDQDHRDEDGREGDHNNSTDDSHEGHDHEDATTMATDGLAQVAASSKAFPKLVLVRAASFVVPCLAMLMHVLYM